MHAKNLSVVGLVSRHLLLLLSLQPHLCLRIECDHMSIGWQFDHMELQRPRFRIAAPTLEGGEARQVELFSTKISICNQQFGRRQLPQQSSIH